MSPRAEDAAKLWEGLPRTRGDEPVGGAALEAGNTSAPHPRG